MLNPNEQAIFWIGFGQGAAFACVVFRIAFVIWKQRVRLRCMLNSKKPRLLA